MFNAANICRNIGTRSIIEDVSLQVNGGEVVGVLGPNGAGKTTLLRALMMLDPPDSGEIVVDDFAYRFPVSRSPIFPPPWPKVSGVLQDIHLWPHLSVWNNLTLPLRNRGNLTDKTSIHKIIDDFGLTDIVRRRAGKLSGGERQRVALARAFLLDPKYLLLDEPTSHLDVRSVKLLLNTLKRAVIGGSGIVVVSHMFGFLRDVADRVVYLESGKLIEQGPVAILGDPQTEKMREFIACL